MAVKSAYRVKPQAQPQPESPPVDFPKVEASSPVEVEAVSIESDVEPHEEARQAINDAIKADEAAEALKRQIEAVRQAEEMQKAANIHLLPLDEKIKVWKANGLSDAEADFLRDNPRVAEHPQISSWAASKALQDGYERDTKGYFDAVRNNFADAMRQVQSQAAHTAPEFFQPPMPKPPAAARTAAHFVSAPVSRGDAPSGGSRAETNPSKITLTAEQVEAAKIAGISTVEYAKQLLRLRREPQGTRQQ